jgi:hypothetical protein
VLDSECTGPASMRQTSVGVAMHRGASRAVVWSSSRNVPGDGLLASCVVRPPAYVAIDGHELADERTPNPGH